MTIIESSRAAAAAQQYAGLSLRAWRMVGIAAVLALACVVPFSLSSYHVFQATQVLVYAMALLGLNILTGYNGQILLGHGAFYALGAYTTAMLLDKTGVPYWATIPVAGFICLIAGFLFGLPALRLEGLYLALATYALAVSTPQILKYKHFEPWTGGVQGVIISKPDAPFGLPLDSDQWLYFFCLVWTVALFVIGSNLLRGRTGRAMVAIRDHPLAAATMGIDTAFYKSLTFGVSAMFTGIAGALASISGAVFGAIFIEFVPNIADQISKAAPSAIYGIFLIACVYVMPMGVAGALRYGAAIVVRLANERRSR
jgi:branched-chain amino acid transport system permease protein